MGLPAHQRNSGVKLADDDLVLFRLSSDVISSARACCWKRVRDPYERALVYVMLGLANPADIKSEYRGLVDGR